MVRVASEVPMYHSTIPSLKHTYASYYHDQKPWNNWLTATKHWTLLGVEAMPKARMHTAAVWGLVEGSTCLPQQ